MGGFTVAEQCVACFTLNVTTTHPLSPKNSSHCQQSQSQNGCKAPRAAAGPGGSAEKYTKEDWQMQGINLPVLVFSHPADIFVHDLNTKIMPVNNFL